MAIEKARTHSPFDMGSDNETVDSVSDDMGEGETLSMSLLGGKEVKPGDIVRIRVQSVDEDEGTWQGVYAEQSKPSAAMGGRMMEGEM